MYKKWGTTYTAHLYRGHAEEEEEDDEEKVKRATWEKATETSNTDWANPYASILFVNVYRYVFPSVFVDLLII